MDKEKILNTAKNIVLIKDAAHDMGDLNKDIQEVYVDNLHIQHKLENAKTVLMELFNTIVEINTNMDKYPLRSVDISSMTVIMGEIASVKEILHQLKKSSECDSVIIEEASSRFAYMACALSQLKHDIVVAGTISEVDE